MTATTTNTKPAHTPVLATTSDACAALSISRTKLYDLIHAKKLEVVKLGRRSTRITWASIHKIGEVA